MRVQRQIGSDLFRSPASLPPPSRRPATAAGVGGVAADLLAVAVPRHAVPAAASNPPASRRRAAARPRRLVGPRPGGRPGPWCSTARRPPAPNRRCCLAATATTGSAGARAARCRCVSARGCSTATTSRSTRPGRGRDAHLLRTVATGRCHRERRRCGAVAAALPAGSVRPGGAVARTVGPSDGCHVQRPVRPESGRGQLVTRPRRRVQRWLLVHAQPLDRQAGQHPRGSLPAAPALAGARLQARPDRPRPCPARRRPRQRDPRPRQLPSTSAPSPTRSRAARTRSSPPAARLGSTTSSGRSSTVASHTHERRLLPRGRRGDRQPLPGARPGVRASTSPAGADPYLLAREPRQGIPPRGGHPAAAQPPA